MKKLFRTFLTFLLCKTDDEYTPERLEKIKKFKQDFLYFFQGDYYYNLPVCNDPIPVKEMEINHFSFSFDEKNKMTVEIWLKRPSLLIGKAGSRIDGLIKYTSEYVKEIKIKEYDIFK